MPPAIEAVLKSEFAAATIAGKPVPCRMRISVKFDVTHGGRSIGHEAFLIAQKSAPGTPAEFQYDEPPRIVTLCEPVYPYKLLLADIHGEAEVTLTVDRDGKIAAARVTSESRREFGAALVAAIETWRFTPPALNGKRSMAVLSWRHVFSSDNRDLTADADGQRIVKQLQAADRKFAELAALDRKPRALYQVPPHYSPLLEEQSVSGAAEVEFIIDLKGKVRAPRVVTATRGEFGWAAATAVQQWFYEPPLLQGKPVDVRVQMPFVFEPQRRDK